MKKLAISLALVSGLVFASSAFAGSAFLRYTCIPEGSLSGFAWVDFVAENGDRKRVTLSCSGGQSTTKNVSMSTPVIRVSEQQDVYGNGVYKYCGKTFKGNPHVSGGTQYCSVGGGNGATFFYFDITN